MPIKIQLPSIPENERTPLVEELLGLLEQLVHENHQQWEVIEQLRDEIAVLKGEKAKPKFKPSGMNEKTDPQDCDQEDKSPSDDDKKKRPGSAKRNKKPHLTIHETKIVVPRQPVPAGSTFKGYQDVTIQDVKIEPYNIRYRREVWITPDGERLTGELPASLKGKTFGPTLHAFILYQHHHCQVTQPLLHEQLKDIGVDISTGQINALLTGHNDDFFEEKDQRLKVGLQQSDFLNVDDSGARHKGKNGYVTHIGNDAFAYFSRTFSKSRINFLELLHAGIPHYVINEHAFDYMSHQGLAKEPLERLQNASQGGIAEAECWERHLDALGIEKQRHRRIATEGALLGGLIAQGFSAKLVIVSDGAGQFDILLHALCWVHAERLIHKTIPLNDQHREEIAKVRDEIWTFYAQLKRYRETPDPCLVQELEARFDAIFTQRTSFETLNRLLKRLHAHKQELLLVLKRPEIPLHNNLSEGDIREYVKKRKISGGTRSDLGRQCRDTFASLKKTCRKQTVSFWYYLLDRTKGAGEVPPLPDLVRDKLFADSRSP